MDRRIEPKTFAQHLSYFLASDYDTYTMAVFYALLMRMAGQCRPGVPFDTFKPALDRHAPDFHLIRTNGVNEECIRDGFEWGYPF